MARGDRIVSFSGGVFDSVFLGFFLKILDTAFDVLERILRFDFIELALDSTDEVDPSMDADFRLFNRLNILAIFDLVEALL